MVELPLALLLKHPLHFIFLNLSTLILHLILGTLLGRHHGGFLADLGPSDGPRGIQIELIGSRRYSLLAIIHHDRIGIGLATLLELLDLGVMVIQVCHEAGHAIDIALEVEGRGLVLHTWCVANALTWEVS